MLHHIIQVIIFIFAGFIGVLYHCLIEMGKLNKKLNGNFVLKNYLRIERFNIMASMVAVIISVMCASFIKQLMKADYYLTPVFICFGYMGQSILIAFFGRASDFIENVTGKKVEIVEEIKTTTTTMTETGPTRLTRDDAGIS